MGLTDFIDYDKQSNTLFCKNVWNLKTLPKLQRIIKSKHFPKADTIIINGKDISELDSAGAWMLMNGISLLTKRKTKLDLNSFSEQHQKIFSLVNDDSHLNKKIKRITKLNWIQSLGKYSIHFINEFHSYLSFIGELTYETLKNIAFFRWNSIVNTINRSGVQALPIIALLSFMIGVVISYQMGNQLQKYGADVFIVDLTGFSILREFGPLITAIMVGGRTGSSFAAQLGIMKINQEIDALQTMGIKPTEILVLPRLAGLFVTVPLLTIWADIFGVFGGMVMANSMLNITWIDFLHRFSENVPVRSLIIGIAKAPVFALIIASIGCYEGMKVQGSAESVGIKTTKSVVLSIFFIIIFDAICSVLLSRYNL